MFTHHFTHVIISVHALGKLGGTYCCTGNCFALSRLVSDFVRVLLLFSGYESASQVRKLERIQKQHFPLLRFVYNVRTKDKVSAFQGVANVLLLKKECRAQTFSLD